MDSLVSMAKELQHSNAGPSSSNGAKVSADLGLRNDQSD